MSAVPEALVEAVVREVSERLADPAYAQLAVGSFVAAQPHITGGADAAGTVGGPFQRFVMQQPRRTVG